MNKFKVPIKNALFMYSYIWDKVDNKDFTKLSSTDDFNSSNIYAELFLINIKKILKRGLFKEYVSQNECLNLVRGKINFKDTINTQCFRYAKLYCNYDELVEDNIYNQIIKFIAIKLYKAIDLSQSNKKKLNKVILYFNKVSYLEIKKEDFKKIHFNKNNDYYFMMIKICELIYNAQMLSENSGKYMFYDLFKNDEDMINVFELFIYKFYKYELKGNNYKVKYQTPLYWNLSGGDQSILPIMKTDTEIISPFETIIIDTKYYENYFVNGRFDKKTLISNNMYQMFTYLNSVNVNNKLTGILLYPLPFYEKPINESYSTEVISSSHITMNATLKFITIDLSKDWKDITYDLLSIVDVNIANSKKKIIESI